MIVDGHAHVWALDPDAYPWQPTFGYVPTVEASPEALLAAMDRLGVDHTLLVQPSAYGPDHRFMLDVVRRSPSRLLAIGLVDPLDPAAGAVAKALVADAGCVGLRVNLSLDLSRAAAQERAAAWTELAGLGVPICLRATPAHHALVTRLLGAHKRTRFVVDHLGLPEADETARSIARLRELGRFEHCSLKVAGLSRLTDAARLQVSVLPLLRAALDAFGERECSGARTTRTWQSTAMARRSPWRRTCRR